MQYMNEYLFTVNGSTPVYYHLHFDENGETNEQHMYKT